MKYQKYEYIVATYPLHHLTDISWRDYASLPDPLADCRVPAACLFLILRLRKVTVLHLLIIIMF